MDKTLHDILTVAVIAAATMSTRALSFIVFSEGRKIPRVVLFLSRVLPSAVIGMLIVYCLRNISPLAYPFGAPEFISVALVVLLHLWLKNTLVSIVGGTVCYMLLIQLVFV